MVWTYVGVPKIFGDAGDPWDVGVSDHRNMLLPICVTVSSLVILGHQTILA